MISVVIPIYNSEKYLRECVDSVLNQTYPDLEVILVDDGSTDSSGVICDEYAVLDSRVRVIHQENARIAAARNAGIEASNGEYITFLDSDDYLSAETYQTALSLMESHNADMVQWDLEYIAGEGYEKDAPELKNKPRLESVSFVTDKWGALRIMMDTNRADGRFNNICQCCNCVWPKLFRRELFREIRFPVGKEYEDLCIVHRLYYAAKGIVFTNERFSFYRMRKSSTIHTMNPKGKLDGIEAFADKLRLVESDPDGKEFVSLAAHNFLTSVINAYPEMKGTVEGVRATRLMRECLGNGSTLDFRDRMVYRLACVSLGAAEWTIRTRRKWRNGKE